MCKKKHLYFSLAYLTTDSARVFKAHRLPIHRSRDAGRGGVTAANVSTAAARQYATEVTVLASM